MHLFRTNSHSLNMNGSPPVSTIEFAFVCSIKDIIVSKLLTSKSLLALGMLFLMQEGHDRLHCSVKTK